MKGSKGITSFIFLLSIISGYLMSKASLVGRAGMSLFYTEYNFLKTWWKGALLIGVALTSLFFLHKFIQQKTGYQQGRTLHWMACFLAITGLYFTYDNFRHTLSHHLLGERFHIGVYLFWIGWITISLYFISNQKQIKIQESALSEDDGNDSLKGNNPSL